MSSFGCIAHVEIFINGMRNVKEKNVKYEREKDISGRLFFEPKIITFWKFPKDKQEFMKVLNALGKFRGENFSF